MHSVYRFCTHTNLASGLSDQQAAASLRYQSGQYVGKRGRRCCDTTPSMTCTLLMLLNTGFPVYSSHTAQHNRDAVGRCCPPPSKVWYMVSASPCAPAHFLWQQGLIMISMLNRRWKFAAYKCSFWELQVDQPKLEHSPQPNHLRLTAAECTVTSSAGHQG